jgi:hypothetical protein
MFVTNAIAAAVEYACVGQILSRLVAKHLPVGVAAFPMSYQSHEAADRTVP